MKLYSNAYEKEKYNHCAYTQIIIKNLLLFFFTVYGNEWKEAFWRQKKIEKSDFYKNKKIYNVDGIDISKILVSRKEPYCTKKSLKTLLDIMIMVLLDHYV